MISFKNNRKKSTSSFKVIVVCLLLSGSLISPSFATHIDDIEHKYGNTWENISGSLTADDAIEKRYIVDSAWRLVDNYKLLDVPDGQSVSIYIKGNPNNNGIGLCNPLGLVYDVTQSSVSIVIFGDDGGEGSFTDGYTGVTCGLSTFDSFFTVDWNSDYRIQVTSNGSLINKDDRTLNTNNSGDYTLYVSVGNLEPTNAIDESQYENSWQNISGSLTAVDAVEERFGVDSWKLVDNYELFDAVGQSVSIYIKGNPEIDVGGLCDPMGLVYDISIEVLEEANIVSNDDGGRGGFTDGYTGVTCGLNTFDSFFTIATWDSNYRIQVSSNGSLIDEERTLDTNNSGDYTLYVSVGNFEPSAPGEDDPPPSGGDSSSSSNVATITPTVVQTEDASFKLTNRKYLSKFEIRKAITKGRSFKRKPIDFYKYSISKTSKKNCVMSGNYVMALKDTGVCEIWVTRTTAKGAKYKYWVKINYSK
jgi:hypothetical protein